MAAWHADKAVCAAQADALAGRQMQAREGLRRYMAGLLVLQALTRTTPCEPCRKYYTHHLRGFCADQQAAVEVRALSNLGLTNFVHAMRCFVDAKLQGDSGNAVGSTTGNVLQLKQRLHIMTSCSVSSASMLQAFMLQALATERRARAGKDSAARTSFRARSIITGMAALAKVLERARPVLSKTIALQLSNTLARAKGKPYTTDLAFKAALACYHKLPDVPRVTEEDMRERLSEAFQTSRDWWCTKLEVPQCTTPAPALAPSLEHSVFRTFRTGSDSEHTHHPPPQEPSS